MGGVRERWQALETGEANAGDWVVPDAHAILAEPARPWRVALRRQRHRLCPRRHEARLLEVDPFFPTGINAPRDNDPAFGKGKVIARVAGGARHSRRGVARLRRWRGGNGGGEGRGRRGGRRGEPGAGERPGGRQRREAVPASSRPCADLIIPDYTRQEELIDWLWG